MPHIILEHNFKNEEVIHQTNKKLFKALCLQESIKEEAVKVRSVFVNHVYISSLSNESKSDFAHVNLKLLTGRSDELKNKMSSALLKVLNDQLKNGSFSVEVSELLNYSK